MVGIQRRETVDPGLRRLELIQRLESELSCKIITYICGDGPLGQANIADDVVPILYKHLSAINSTPHEKRPDIALYLYARGGATETPWKIATLIRDMCARFTVIIPYKAHSATTMIAMAADKILMHEMGELGPVDPSMRLTGDTRSGNDHPMLPEIGVEDIAAFLRFLKNRVGLSDQTALAQLASNLTQSLAPPVLGRLERVYSHAQVVTSKLLGLHKPPMDTDRIARIVDALTEKCYVHGHAVRRAEAKEIGLDVEALGKDANLLTWELYQNYCDAMWLDHPKHPSNYIGGHAEYVKEDIPIAFVESNHMSHAFMGRSAMRQTRTLPPNVNFNLNLNVPRTEQLGQVNTEDLAKALMPMIQQQINQAIAQVAPEPRYIIEYHGKWITLQ